MNPNDLFSIYWIYIFFWSLTIQRWIRPHCLALVFIFSEEEQTWSQKNILHYETYNIGGINQSAVWKMGWLLGGRWARESFVKETALCSVFKDNYTFEWLGRALRIEATAREELFKTRDYASRMFFVLCSWWYWMNLNFPECILSWQ